MNAATITTMKQLGRGLNLSTKKTRKREFLEEMERVVPWSALVQVAQPHYGSAKTSKPPFALETMLRVHYLQQSFGLSDPAMEEALHDVPLYREFAQLAEGSTRLPDETTILRFRHLLEKHNLAVDMLRVVNDILQANGLLLRSGTAVDATLIAAPSSTKNDKGERLGDEADEEGEPVVLGMKAHIGVDIQSGLVHSVVGTAASVHDVNVVADLLHGDEEVAFGDAEYQGAHRREAARGPTWHVAMRPGKRRVLNTFMHADFLIERAEKSAQDAVEDAGMSPSARRGTPVARAEIAALSEAESPLAAPNRARRHG